MLIFDKQNESRLQDAMRGRLLTETERLRWLKLRVRGHSFEAIHLVTGILKSTVVTTLERGRPMKPRGRVRTLGRADANAIREWVVKSKVESN